MADLRFLAPLAVVLGMLWSVPAATATHVRCGDVITQDTTLDADLFCSGNGLGVIGGNVTLNLNGHIIEGDGGDYGVFPFLSETPAAGPFNLKLINGTIRGFQFALSMDGPERVLVDEMVIEGNGEGLRCQYIPVCDIEDSTFRHNGRAVRLLAADSNPVGAVRRNRIYENGSGLQVTGYDAPVTGNVVKRNDDFGIWLDYEGDAHVTANVVAENGSDGVMVTFQTQATVARNLIVRNGGNGVSADYQVEVNIRDNHVSRNGEDGVFIGRYVTALLERNRADRNGDDGIDVDPCLEVNCDFYGVTVGANKAFFNADLGIEAAPGTADGGGNRAKHNGNQAQCVGVSCK